MYATAMSAGALPLPRKERRGSRVRRPRNTVPRTTEPRESTLRLALSLGREGAEVAVEAPEPDPAAAAPSCGGGAPPTLAVGVITAPGNTLRRSFIRRAHAVLMAGRRCDVSVAFLLGLRKYFTPAQNAALDREQAVHHDLLFLPSHDGLGKDV